MRAKPVRLVARTFDAVRFVEHGQRLACAAKGRKHARERRRRMIVNRCDLLAAKLGAYELDRLERPIDVPGFVELPRELQHQREVRVLLSRAPKFLRAELTPHAGSMNFSHEAERE